MGAVVQDVPAWHGGSAAPGSNRYTGQNRRKHPGRCPRLGGTGGHRELHSGGGGRSGDREAVEEEASVVEEVQATEEPSPEEEVRSDPEESVTKPADEL